MLHTIFLILVALFMILVATLVLVQMELLPNYFLVFKYLRDTKFNMKNFKYAVNTYVFHRKEK